MLVEERGITKVLTKQRPPHELIADLATCPASEISELTSFAEAGAPDHVLIWREAMAKEFNGREATGSNQRWRIVFGEVGFLVEFGRERESVQGEAEAYSCRIESA